MSINQPMNAHRRLGVLILTGAAAGLIALAASGAAAASPDVPFDPGNIAIYADSSGLNPQPLPQSPDRVALNPQPLPPRADWSRVALNPQPLPPGPDWKRALAPRLGF